MRVRTTKRLTPEEVELLLAIGARDEKDFVYSSEEGEEQGLAPDMEWDVEKIRRVVEEDWRGGEGCGFYLFEKIEEDEKL